MSVISLFNKIILGLNPLPALRTRRDASAILRFSRLTLFPMPLSSRCPCNPHTSNTSPRRKDNQISLPLSLPYFLCSFPLSLFLAFLPHLTSSPVCVNSVFHFLFHKLFHFPSLLPPTTPHHSNNRFASHPLPPHSQLSQMSSATLLTLVALLLAVAALVVAPATAE